MWNEPTKEQLAKIPKLYETEGVALKEKLVWLHFFLGAFDWYIAEYDGKRLFWGYVFLTGDFERTDWGYISFDELKRIKIPPGFEVDRETCWQVKKAIQIEKIRMGNHWSQTEEPKKSSSRKEKTDEAHTGYGVGGDH